MLRNDLFGRERAQAMSSLISKIKEYYFPEQTECSLNNGGARKSEVLTDINKLCTELVK